MLRAQFCQVHSRSLNSAFHQTYPSLSAKWNGVLPPARTICRDIFNSLNVPQHQPSNPYLATHAVCLSPEAPPNKTSTTALSLILALTGLGKEKRGILYILHIYTTLFLRRLGEPSTQGQRCDLASLREAVYMRNMSTRDIYDDPELAVVALRYPHAESRLRQVSIRPRNSDVPPLIYVLIGASGCGKTRAVEDLLKELGIRDDCYKWFNSKWWDGYVGQACVFMDEMSGNELQWRQWKMILDRYEHIVEVKNDTIQLRAKIFFICSNVHPSNWSIDKKEYETGEDPLIRRMNQYGKIYDCPTELAAFKMHARTHVKQHIELIKQNE